MLNQQRSKDQHGIEFKKKRKQSDLNIDDGISNIFTARQDCEDLNFAPEAVGLVTLEELKAQQEAIIAAREKQSAAEKCDKSVDKEHSIDEEKHDQSRKGPVSFQDDDELDSEDSEGGQPTGLTPDKSDETAPPSKKHKRYGVNPRVDTRFIPDIYRKEEENKLREEIKQEWLDRQIAIKAEEIRITYSYWDGSGHHRDIVARKGYSIQAFLARCLEQLRKEFPELRATSVDKLMFVKEDLIIPHHNTFDEFITTKARGKSGPLFVFDVRDDVRIVQDSSIEKEDSHAGKIKHSGRK